MYLLTPYPNGFKSLDLPESEDYEDYGFLSWNGQPRADRWKAPTIEWFEDDLTSPADRQGDFAAFGGGPIAISGEAYSVLYNELAGQVEFLPTIGPTKNESWYLLNVINVIDLLEPSKSLYEIYEDGEVGICQHGFLNTPDTSHRIFEVKDYAPYIFIDEKTKNIIESAGLTGVLIREYLNP